MKTKLTEAEMVKAKALMKGRVVYGMLIPKEVDQEPARKWAMAKAAACDKLDDYSFTRAGKEERFAAVYNKAMSIPPAARRSAKQKWLNATPEWHRPVPPDTMCVSWKYSFPKPAKVPSYATLADASVVEKVYEVEGLSLARRKALGLKGAYAQVKRQEVFSVEIEFVCSVGSALDSPRFFYPNGRNVQFVSDGSVSPAEGQASPTEKEVRISLEWGNVKRLYETCKFLRDAGAVVNRTCGMHVHLDSRHLTAAAERTRRIRLISALPWLLELVPVSRRTNRYCWPNHLPNPPLSEARYRAINPKSYSRHKTPEIRLGSGTIDPDKIINWATMLKYIADQRKRFNTFESFLKSDAPQHIKIWAVLRRDKFFPAPGMVTECGETETT